MGQISKREKKTYLRRNVLIEKILKNKAKIPEWYILGKSSEGDSLEIGLEKVLRKYGIRGETEENRIYKKNQEEIGRVLLNIEGNNQNLLTSYEDHRKALDFILSPGGPNRNNYDIRKIIKTGEKEKVINFYNRLRSREDIIKTEIGSSKTKKDDDTKIHIDNIIEEIIVVDEKLKNLLFELFDANKTTITYDKSGNTKTGYEFKIKEYIEQEKGIFFETPGVLAFYNPYKKPKNKKEAITPAIKGLLEIGYVFAKSHKTNKNL